MPDPARADIWVADLRPTRGHEQSGKRPVLILSHDLYNRGPSGLVIVLPVTSTDRGIPIHVALEPPEGGIKHRSVVLCDAIRSISKERLVAHWGRISPRAMGEIEHRVRVLLGL